MSEFSDVLEYHIMMCGLTENYLAKITGFSRSYIAKLKNGQRISPDMDKMTALFEVLNLTSAEYAVLWDLYLKERMGKENYYLNKEILSFISSFHMTSNIDIQMDVSLQIPDVRLVSGRTDVEYITKMIINKEASKEKGHLRVLMQGENDRILESIKNALKMNGNFEVEHLVCMEKMTDKNDYQNIHLLQALIPLILCRQNYGYRIYYHYDNISAHFSSFSWIPYCIITEDYYIGMDVSFEHSIICKDKDIRNCMADMFDRMTDGCRQLYQPIDSDVHMVNYYSRLDIIADNMYTMAYQPCMGILEVEDLFDKYAREEYRTVLDGLRKRIWDSREMYMKNHCQLFTYFTKAGMEEFMRTGTSRELPEDIYVPIDYEDRKKVIQSMLRLADIGLYNPYLIDDRKFQWPEGLIIDSSDLKYTGLFYNANQKCNRFIIEEMSLARLFHEFMENFRNSTYTKTRDETIAYLKGLLK